MDPPAEPTTARALGAAGLALGLFALAVAWWFPFGLILAAAGLPLGLIGCAARPRGDRIAPLGTAVCAAALGATLFLGWGTYVRLFGL